MKPNISEFSYGFALTAELAYAPGALIRGAPVFPSLYDEGRPGGGWDVMLNRPGLPLFLQFKLADCMKSRACKEHRDGRIRVPCYRMHLRPSRHSDQHALLLDLETDGHEVYYSAPAFHEPHELDDAYVTRNVRNRSLWIRPSQIGPLPDDKDHHVSFKPNGPWLRFSEPRVLDGVMDFEALQNRLVSKLRDGDRLGPNALERLANDMITLLEKQDAFEERSRSRVRENLRGGPPLWRASYLAATFFHCQLFLAWSVDDNAG